MPLSEAFESRLRLRFGLSVPSLTEQVAEQGLRLTTPELWEQRHRALNLLRVGGFLTDAETERIIARLHRGICRAAGFEEAIDDVILQVLASLEEEGVAAAATPPTPLHAVSDPVATSTPALITTEAPSSPSALDDYLSNRPAG